MFVHGEYLDHTFATEPEPLDVIAQVIASGDTLEFRDVAIFCGGGVARVSVGVGVLLRIVRELEVLVRDSGYNYLVITGDRHTGASPNRDVLLRRKLR